ncbi:hypothetical protein FACS1894162_3620 [Bacteroidia bacterium]|nr:hypothetical protein FACS1894162_3620 [Bacteroidia bacterium]
MGCGMVVSGFVRNVPGSLNMAIQKEIWMSSIIEGLFADNSFLSKAFNADEFVNSGKTVHIPNAGTPSNVVKNRTGKPATVETRTDVDLTFNLDEYTTDPIYISNAETVELSYTKRESVLSQDKAKLIDEVSKGILFNWAPLSANSVKTTGPADNAYTDSATGNRFNILKSDVLNVMTKFNADNVPMTERYLLLDAQMYSQLLNDLTDKESQAFFAAADVKRGVVGQLYSFDVMLRSQVLRYTGGGSAKDWSTAGSATDCAAALAWHKNSVCRAKGEIKAFETEDDPTWYGDIYSFLVRAGGRKMRNDVKGVVAIIQGAA